MLGSGSERSQEGVWGSDRSLPPVDQGAVLGIQPVAAAPKREISADLLELVVILCRRDGRRRSVLKAIRCFRNDTLSEIRNVMANEIPSLPVQFSFLRIVGGHVVLVTKDQESGIKGYKAKHFAPPHSEKPHLLIYDREPATVTPLRNTSTREVSEGVIEYCVRCMTEGKLTDEGTVLGMIRLHRDATLAEIRSDLASQLPQTPHEYRSVLICSYRLSQQNCFFLSKLLIFFLD